MVFKNYCIVFLSPTDGVKKEVVKIAEGSPREIFGKGIAIYTFSSVIDIPVLKEYFKSFKRNFLLFDLNENYSGVNFLDDKIQSELFGFVNDKDNMNNLESLSNKLIDDILSHTKNLYTYNTTKSDNLGSGYTYNNPKNQMGKHKDKHYNENIDFSELSREEINERMNKIIDKGVENLTDYDKKILAKLSNYI